MCSFKTTFHNGPFSFSFSLHAFRISQSFRSLGCLEESVVEPPTRRGKKSFEFHFIYNLCLSLTSAKGMRFSRLYLNCFLRSHENFLFERQFRKDARRPCCQSKPRAFHRQAGKDSRIVPPVPAFESNQPKLCLNIFKRSSQETDLVLYSPKFSILKS